MPSHTNTSLFQGVANAQVYRAGKCGSTNQWTLENNSSVCGGGSTAGANNDKGPGGGVFYYDNTYGSNHEELCFGGLAMLAGKSEILETALDPFDLISGGVIHLNNTTGQKGALYQIYSSGNDSGLFGKANGMGDIELLCAPQPIEIGNRVFMDTNSDGIQDPNEMGLDGIIVELWKAGSRVTDVTTTNGGEWYFGNLDAETDYEVKTLGSSFPTGKSLTTSNATSNGKDLIDNDATLVGLDAVITYKTGTAGQNNHSLDFGFKVGCSLTATAAGTNPKCNAGTDGAASVEPSGNAGPVTYLWSNTQTTQAITGLTAGVYTVTVTESPSCTAVATVTLTEPAAIVLVCTKTDATTIGGSEGTATVVASGGTSPYTYLWSNGSTSDTQASLPAGTYTVTVTDANACTSTCSSVVSEPGCNLAATATGTNPKCNLGTDGAVSLPVTGAVGTPTYLWSNGATTQHLTAIGAGTYTVTVTEGTCMTTASVTLTEPTAIVLVCTKTDATTVGGSEGIATVVASGGTSPYTYAWSNTQTTAGISGLPKGTYTVTVTDANGCTSSCSSIVTEPGAPVCDLADAGLSTYIDQKGTASTADDEYVISANPTGTGLAATYNVTGDITKTSVAYGSVVEIGRVPISTVMVNVILTDAGTSTCSVADGAYNLNGNSCLLLANPIVLCNDNGTPTIVTDDTYSITINPTGNGLTGNYNVTGDLTVSGLAYGSAQQIGTGLAISAGGKTISVIDAIKVDCKLLNINIAPPATCSAGTTPCPTKICTPVKITKL